MIDILKIAILHTSPYTTLDSIAKVETAIKCQFLYIKSVTTYGNASRVGKVLKNGLITSFLKSSSGWIKRLDGSIDRFLEVIQ